MTVWTAEHALPRNYRQRLATMLPAIQLCYFSLLWPLVYARGGMTADLMTGPVEPTGSFFLNKLFFPAMASLSILLLVAERHRLTRFHLTGFLLVVSFFAYICMTAMWALAPSVTLSKLVLMAMQIIGLLPAVLLARRMDDLFRPMFWVMVATLAVNVAAVVVLPPTPIGHAGIYAHKNTLGATIALVGFFAFYGLTREGRLTRVISLLMLPVVLALLYVSQSKTSLALFVASPFIALGVVFARRYLRIAFPVLIVVTITAGAFVLGGALPGFSFHDISVALTGDGSFTGRTELWDFALGAIAERPLTGYGYQSFWGIGPESPAARMVDTFVGKTPHAHNGYVDILLQGGLIALTLFVLILLMIARWTDHLVDYEPSTGFFAICLFAYLLLLNLLETSWLQTLSASSMLSLLLMFSASVTHERRSLV